MSPNGTGPNGSSVFGRGIEEKSVARTKNDRATKTLKVLEPIETGLPSSTRFKLSESRHVVIEKFRELPYVKIRDYHQVKKKGFPLVPGRGINLTVTEWECLKTL